MQRSTTQVTVGETKITFETGKIAKQANGSVLVRSGDTIVFSAATAAKEPAENVDFFPLRIDYQEKFSSAGKTLGGFIKREGRPTERETLMARLIDRPLRPMFEEGYTNETQILTSVWSYDGENMPEPLAICAAAASLAISDIPLSKPVAGVRVGYVNGTFVLNPSREKQKESLLDLMIAGTEDAVLMIEGYCDFLSEEQVIEAIEIGHEGIKTICKAIKEWCSTAGKPKNRDSLRKMPEELLTAVDQLMRPSLGKVLQISDKKEREAALDGLKEEVLSKLCPEQIETPKYDSVFVSKAVKKIKSQFMRTMILNNGVRSDGRKPDEIRNIDIEQGLLPRTHGSSLFTRGETQALAVCTLGGESMAQRYEDLNIDGVRRFYLQYFFPPFSVGEVGRMGPAGRREVGHGKLAERALKYTLPSKEKFPYTIRLESNITESNGSSSMASVCGGCLALMEAGVPIKRAVSGIAMGLILENSTSIILSDILGIEDSLGDMDFKVTGDQTGITAFQMDIKIEGITVEIMRRALAQAKEGRIQILEKMLEACPAPKEMSIYAPRIETLRIKPSKIAVVIGPGGKQIRAIVEETGVDIDISDDGIVSIASSNSQGIAQAKQIIESLTAEAEVNKVYTGRVTSIKDFGVFVEILPGKEGLCHVSEFDTMRINNLNDYVKVGDEITVKLLEINDRGQLRLSRKALLHRRPT